VIAEVAPGPTNCLGTGRAFKSNEFFVVAESDGQTLEETLSVVRAAQKRDGGESPVFGVPGNSHVLPFFDRSVDELFVHSGDSKTLTEAGRVLRGDGLLYAPKYASPDAALLRSLGLVAVFGELSIGEFSVFLKNAN
jgi:hypothetical protein